MLGNRVYITCYSGYGVPDAPGGSLSELKRHLVAVDRGTGTIVWNTAIAAETPEDPYDGFLTEHGYASSTPVTDGERIYVFFGKTGVLAFDLNGAEVWRRNVGRESSAMRWGSGSSPVLVGDLVIVNAAEESLSLRGLDRKGGAEVWKADGSILEACYGTPAVASLPDGQQEVIVSGAGEVWGVNPATGKLRWFAETNLQGAISPSVVVQDGIGFLFGGRGTPATAIRVGGKGDLSEVPPVWRGQSNSNVPTPVLVDGRLYWIGDGGVAVCLDAATGEKVFEKRLGIDLKGGPAYASPVAAGGRVYQVTSRGGTVVFAAAPEFQLIAHNEIDGDFTDFNGTPAISGDELFLRSNNALYCIAEPRAN
ncbi:MAG: PQQ-like beta-propeller repeat protein [Planctomyces sp.]|nr:PQQ-like beta-propeller repeat protein [Planctomyces sp.]